jgi:hypothetical protein
MGGGSLPAVAEDVAATPIPLVAPTLYNPANGATDFPTLTPPATQVQSLSWTGTEPFLNDVYFGTTSPPPLVAADGYATTYTLPRLDPCTTYYWKVVSKNAGGSLSSPIWSFTTAASVSLTASYIRFPAAGGTGYISVNSPAACPWKVSGIILSVYPTSGKGNDTVAYIVPPNSALTAKTYLIRVADRALLIRQDAAVPCSYSVSAPTSIDSAQQPVSISVNTGVNCAWTMSSDQLWLPANSSGPETGSAIITVTASANSTGAARTAQLTITGAGPLAGPPASLSITQR